MIGLSTETGRRTAVTPSSSSEDKGLLDPTLASSDLSQPVTPRQEGNDRLQNGDPSPVPLEVPSSGDHAEHPTAHNMEKATPARGEATVPNPPENLLLILQHMQQQQLQH